MEYKIGEIIPATFAKFLVLASLVLTYTSYSVCGQELYRVYHTTSFSNDEVSPVLKNNGLYDEWGFDKPLGWRGTDMFQTFLGTLWSFGTDSSYFFAQKILSFDYQEPYRINAKVKLENAPFAEPENDNPTYCGLIVGKAGHSCKKDSNKTNNAHVYLLSSNSEMVIGKIIRDSLIIEHEEPLSFPLNEDSNFIDFELEQSGGAMYFKINNHNSGYYQKAIEPFGKYIGFILWNGGFMDALSFSLYTPEHKHDTLDDLFELIKSSGINVKREVLGTGHREKLSYKTVNDISAFEKSPRIQPDGKRLNFVRNYYYTDPTDKYWYADIDAQGNFKAAKMHGEPFHRRKKKRISLGNGQFIEFPTMEYETLGIGINFSPDGNRILTRNYLYIDGKFERGYAFYEKTKNGWSDPIPIKIDNYTKYDKGKYYNAFYCQDGKTIIFSLDSTDNEEYINHLFVSFMKDDKTWTEPKSLGNTLNFPNKTTITPFLAADGRTLYFATDGLPGYGSTDIFYTKRLDSTWTNWSEPVNMGPEFNNSEWDAYFSTSAKSDYAYFVAMEPYMLFADIFRIPINQEARPDPVQLVFGKVIEKETKRALNASITARDMDTGEELAIAHSDPSSGAFKLILPKGRKYIFYAIKEGYYSQQIQVDLDSLVNYKEDSVELEMTPLEIDNIIELKNILFVRSKPTLLPESEPTLKYTARVLKENPTVVVRVEGHTDNTGSSRLNQILSEERATVIMKYLVDHGVSQRRLSAKGYGDTRPLYNIGSMRKFNRRVELLILDK